MQRSRKCVSLLLWGSESEFLQEGLTDNTQSAATTSWKGSGRRYLVILIDTLRNQTLTHIENHLIVTFWNSVRGVVCIGALSQINEH